MLSPVTRLQIEVGFEAKTSSDLFWSFIIASIFPWFATLARKGICCFIVGFYKLVLLLPGESVNDDVRGLVLVLEHGLVAHVSTY